MLRDCWRAAACVAALCASACLPVPAVSAASAASAESASADAARWHVGETARVFHPAAVRHWRGAKTEALVTQVWYPVDADVPQAPHDIGAPGRPLFHGHPAAVDAPVSAAQARYPLLVLSHGTGGSADSLDWLAASLAADGYIVAGTNHPGNNALEPLTQDGFMLWWERATDASEVIDGILADPQLGPHVDPQRIGGLGFSLGGYTVLELAGARTDAASLERFCASPAADAICHPPEKARLTGDQARTPTLATLSPQTRASRARAGASYRDPRVKAVFAIAPALGEAFDTDSFAQVTIPVTLLAGTADVTAPVNTNIRRIAALLPGADVVYLPGAAHYTFLDPCFPRAFHHLATICKDDPGVDREAIQAQTAKLARDFFGATLH
ncbi:putative dienelactone hydrolase [Paraburkholderia sp. GAS199]|uniref:alpha/beta hydrolase family protein n=1 Tax=Paraburkholderia sp. GAS199 TaxID=3035126 RepID=UPI003D1F128E